MLTFSWRTVFVLLGLVAFILGGVFARFGRGGEFKGQVTNIASVKAILSNSTFWIMVVLFSLGISGTLGIFTMLPLYLVSEHGFERNWANTLIAISRIAGLGIVFFWWVGYGSFRAKTNSMHCLYPVWDIDPAARHVSQKLDCSYYHFATDCCGVLFPCRHCRYIHGNLPKRKKHSYFTNGSTCFSNRWRRHTGNDRFYRRPWIICMGGQSGWRINPHRSDLSRTFEILYF